MTFAELVAAGILLLAPDLATEATLVSVQQAAPDAPYVAYLAFEQPDTIWINTQYVTSPFLMRVYLAHELTHHRDWRLGTLTPQTCGEDFLRAEYRALVAQDTWQPINEPLMLSYLRAQPTNQRPCQEAA